jgi:DNA-binding CsgD family transcriptional regulator
LLERAAEVRAIGDALDGASAGTVGSSLLIEGPPGIGKTRLLEELRAQANARGFRVLAARGSEIERDFGFGVVRQLLGATVEALDATARARLFRGAAANAGPVFQLTDHGPDRMQAGTLEAAMYGLYWLLLGLAETQPLVIVVDDAHWADTASLRFIHYAQRRLDDAPVLVALGARPNEPGAQAKLLGELMEELPLRTVRPALLSKAATEKLVAARLVGRSSPELASACHDATGGNPLLINELLADLVRGDGPVEDAVVARVGPERIARSVMARSRRIDPRAEDVVRAAAVLGHGSSLQVVSELAEVAPDSISEIVDGLAAASIFAPESTPRFVHPLLRAAVYDAIPAASRAAAHARAATVLKANEAAAEEIAAHLLLTSPGMSPSAVEVLDEAARNAARMGAPESTVAYLQRALAEPAAQPARGERLKRLGDAEVAIRDPAAIGHLRQAADLIQEPAGALEITLQLADALLMSGAWGHALETIDAGLDRVEDSGLPGLLELEAFRGGYRTYDPAEFAELERDLPRLRALVHGRRDRESSSLRWMLAYVGARTDAPREDVLELLAADGKQLSVTRGDRESSHVALAMSALLWVDALDEGTPAAAALLDGGRRQGSLLGMATGSGFAAAMNARAGRLDEGEPNLSAAIELVKEHELGTMAVLCFLHDSVDVLVERPGLSDVAQLAEELVLPVEISRTYAGAQLLESRALVRLRRGDRNGGVADLRAAERVFRPLMVGPRTSAWRSRLALALPAGSRAEALDLVDEELELARQVDSPRAIGVALRARGVLVGGPAGIGLLEESVDVLRRSPSSYEVARSLAALGGALRRSNRRNDARERLREALDGAQRSGAQRLEEHVLEELRVAGAKPRRRDVSGPASLTPAEHRVAAAAATGATNREIAQTLFVSQRMVEMHLSNCYRKLGISSRSEVADAIKT